MGKEIQEWQKLLAVCRKIMFWGLRIFFSKMLLISVGVNFAGVDISEVTTFPSTYFDTLKGIRIKQSEKAYQSR